MKSPWEIDGIKEHPSLGSDMEADVAIVGGGLAGVWLSYLLSKGGKKVVLIDKDRLGRSETMYTTALITQVIDTDLSDLRSMFGDKRARLSWQAGAEALSMIEEAVDEEGVECDFLKISLRSYGRSEKELNKLRQEVKAARDLGFEAELTGPLHGFKNLGAMEVPDQAKYHPINFLNSLVDAAEKQGAKFFEKTEAVDISGRTDIHVLTKSGHSIKAKDVIVTTYEPFNNPKETHWKKGMYTTYVYALELIGSDLDEMMCEDMSNPYHYFRVDKEDDKMTMIVGGVDHRAELKFEESKSFRALKDYIDETFPQLDYKITHKWSGKILEPSDGLPLIGEYSPHQYVATGFSGNGMTYSAISGKIITDLIMGRGSVYRDLYDPRRRLAAKPILFNFRDYAEEFFGGAVKNLFK